MRTIALRFSNNFAPESGTIAAHEELIARNGYVWYGKLGSPLSTKVIEAVLKNEDARFLLIHSGTQKRYWAHISAIQREQPNLGEVPEYYHDKADKIHAWFKVTRFENADPKVMSHCVVASSQMPLSAASRHSMSPYFIIDYKE